MERNKREAKQPEKYIIPAICYPRIRKKKHQKKRAVIQAEFQSIPFPLKFVYTQKVFAFYAVRLFLPFIIFNFTRKLIPIRIWF